MELFDVGMWGMCMALCVWVGAAMAGAGGGRRGQLGFSTMCAAVGTAGGAAAGAAGGWAAPCQADFLI